MFDKLLEFLISVWDKITFFQIVKQYQQGAWLRFGKLKTIVDPGIHFKIPIFDEIDCYHVLTTAMPLEAQSLTTKDDKEIVVKGVIKYKISDLSKFFTDVYDAVDAISDVSMGIIRNVIAKKTWEECKEETVDNEITKKVRTEAKKWGIEVESVTLSDLSKMRSFRLLTISSNKTNED
jgi:regulator of protease activity HflC (stomatin/prohibitin superfamily)